MSPESDRPRSLFEKVWDAHLVKAETADQRMRRGSCAKVLHLPEIRMYRHEAGMPLRTSIEPSLTLR